ncbi:Co2+/Mg2+ efflux protein ApaG [Acidocella aromatica]|uniref:Protein ApaG n=1 Tax=Acidocella aromatica TaxID=1303579 RepID=A0A840VCY4_9PROT|nr:Co2+/Mg2+ efflux protein ApaG [Acidocella aromatica]MBB5373703.1 ApaG protein [Acidocella aromatica]
MATTHDITVEVQVFYLADQSKPDSGEFFWAYQITIVNNGRFAVQLLRRSWRITDAHGRLQTVHGEGVVGEQPVIQPGEAFEYTSGVPLSTPSGFMAGQYHMRAIPSGAQFDIEIPAFSLDSPYQNTRLH